MRDGVDFGREVARVSGSDAAYITDLLRSVYEIRTACGEEDEILGDFIEALEECDCIEIVDQEEFLVDAD